MPKLTPEQVRLIKENFGKFGRGDPNFHIPTPEEERIQDVPAPVPAELSVDINEPKQDIYTRDQQEMAIDRSIDDARSAKARSLIPQISQLETYPATEEEAKRQERARRFRAIIGK